jgi:hypothetical protein
LVGLDRAWTVEVGMVDVVGAGADVGSFGRLVGSGISPVVVASIVGRVFVWLGCDLT